MTSHLVHFLSKAPEAFNHLLNYLPIKDLAALSSTCKTLMRPSNQILSKKCNACVTNFFSLMDAYGNTLCEKEPGAEASMRKFSHFYGTHISKKIDLEGHYIYGKKQSQTDISLSLTPSVPPISTPSILDVQQLPSPPSPLFSFPFRFVAHFYEEAKTIEQKRACLCYLLYCQHYNAEFTVDESLRLGYCPPLFAPQVDSGYIRTEYKRLFELVTPWIKEHITPFFTTSFGKANPLNLIKLSSLSIKPVLEFFFKEQLREIGSLSSKKTTEKEFVFIEITPDDLTKDAYQIVEDLVAKLSLDLENIKRNHPQICFLFLLQWPTIDCLLVWGAKWGRPSQLQCIKLDSAEMFGNKTKPTSDELSIFSLLNEAGAVPDRLSLNAFLTKSLGHEEFSTELRKLEPATPIQIDQRAISVFDATVTWHLQMIKLERLKIVDDPGSELYRKAILRWHHSFFEFYKLTRFAAPLLSSQVAPWILNAHGENEIVQWAKAYQNLCEVVMFCLQFFPEKFSQLDLESVLLKSLHEKQNIPATIGTSVGLFPYAMAGFLHIFDHLSGRFEKAAQTFTMTCICQTYFETLNLIKLAGTKRSALISSSTNQARLEDIQEIPAVLIADIHPNNAAKELLFQNDIGGWITKSLEANPSKTMILILDITLNNLWDKIIQKTLEKLVPFIQEGRLEIFAIQSLAKLVQVGGDNFSGGACLYLGNSHEEVALNFPPPLPEKSQFFSLMHLHFQDITTAYFRLIRKNADFMYRILALRFSEIAKQVTIERSVVQTDKKIIERKIDHFCAAKLTLNGDNNTVYIAINFSPLLRELKITDKKEIENDVISLKKLMVELAEALHLPLTSRQSFGFSLSNMNHMVEAIRFSLGIEKRKLMLNYADLVADFIYALSKSVAKDPQQFKLTNFVAEFRKVIAVLAQGEMPISLTAPLAEETVDEWLNDKLEPAGNVVIHFKNHQLSLEVIEEKKGGHPVVTTVIHPAIRFGMTPCLTSPSSSDLIRFFFHVLCFNAMPKYVTINSFQEMDQYVIHGLFEDHFSFLPTREVHDNNSKIRIVFEPSFSLTLPGNHQLTNPQVFVNIPELNMGSVPVSLSKLDAAGRYQVFIKCVRYDFELVPHEEEGTFLLKFNKQKPHLHYQQKLVRRYKKGGLFAVVKSINKLDFENLPIASDFSWKFQQRPSEALHEALSWLGAYLSPILTDKMIFAIIGFNADSCRKAFLKGVFENLLDASLNKKCGLKPRVAKLFSELFDNQELNFRIDGYTFDQWILELDRHLKWEMDDSDIPRLTPYLVALFPLMKCTSLHDTEHSIALRDIAKKTGFLPLLEHIAELEKDAQEVKDVNNSQSITNYLGIYAYYPLHEFEKQNLLSHLHQVPYELRQKWIYQPKFYYRPLDEFEISMNWDFDLIFSTEHRLLLLNFFTSLGGRAILLNDLTFGKEEAISATLRWAIMTQDPDLFSHLWEICQKPINHHTLEQLQHYQKYLDPLVPLQLDLINFINWIR